MIYSDDFPKNNINFASKYACTYQLQVMLFVIKKNKLILIIYVRFNFSRYRFLYIPF